MLRFTLAATLCTIAWNATAQFNVSGTIQDSKTNEVLGGATVQIETLNKFTSTDAQGAFVLGMIPAGSYLVKIKMLGYAEKSEPVDVRDNLFLKIALEEVALVTDEVVVTATRATDKSPTTFTTLQKAAIQQQNFGQDMPFILNWTPSLVTTSDAGAGVGYTGLRIRGSDATRINVTINGIPYNDSESQGTYWVDIPDVASSTQSIQIQRGVGTSTNGAGAFGASINLQTNTRNDKPYADVINSYGSFNTHRHTVGFGTGLINNKFVFDGRASIIKSDGYIDRASSDLKSYYFSGGYYGKRTMIKAIVFGGSEVTYQSWYGVPQSRLNNDTAAMRQTSIAEGWNTIQTQNLFNSNSRTFNAYTYKNQVDNYSQDHYQLHLSHSFSDVFKANTAFHYTYGRGYYEEFRYNDAFANYGVPNAVIGMDTVKSSDLVRRLWLSNKFYGITYSLNYEKDRLNSILGGGWNHYDGDHYGEITWARVATTAPQDYRYYFNNGNKYDFNVFWKNQYQLTDRLNGFLDLQYRGIKYHAAGTEDAAFDFRVNYNFFNPKVGLTYTIGHDYLYASYSIGNREPVRDDFVALFGGQFPKHETLRNAEVGWKVRRPNYTLNLNYYLMDYKNQLVLTGQLNDVGNAIRANVDKSYREGIEVEGAIRMSAKLHWNANLTLSRNKISTFNEVLYDYGVNYDQYNPVVRGHRNADISFSPNVIAGSAFGYSPVKRFEVTLLTKFVGDQFLDNTSNEARKINSYLVNDLRFIYTLKPEFMRELSLSLLANNIAGVKYVSNGYTYGYLGGGSEVRQNYYYPQARRNFLAMVTLRF